VSKERLPVAKPTQYRIRVQGRLDARRAARLAGMEATIEDSAGRGTVTVLTGSLRDQAELAGVLNTLCESHFLVLSVERLPGPQPEDT
jgi:hypothetical protein